MLATLISLAALYMQSDMKSLLSSSIPTAVLACAWAGALGGVAISLKGVSNHPAKRDPGKFTSARDDEAVLWSNEMMPWHLTRPFSGLIVGIFVYMALKAVYPTGSPAPATLAAGSFVLGTQERRFFDFVRKIGAVVVSVPDGAGKDPA